MISAGSQPAVVRETRLRVRYAETDQMGVVYYAHYFVWMEMGRAEYCRSLGLRYRDMEAEDGLLLAVAEAHCRYLAPARYDDEVVVRTWVGEVNPRAIRFEYEILHADTGRRLATGFTRHIFCGPDLRPRRLPQKYWSVFGISERNGPSQTVP